MVKFYKYDGKNLTEYDDTKTILNQLQVLINDSIIENKTDRTEQLRQCIKEVKTNDFDFKINNIEYYSSDLPF